MLRCRDEGGTVNCEIVVSDTEVSSVHKQDTDYALVLNQQSFDRFIERVKSGGTIIANSTLVKEARPREDIKYVLRRWVKLQMNLEPARLQMLFR